MRRVEKRCGTSNAYSPASLTGPQRRVSPGHRAHELGMAVPAALPDIDLPAELLELGIVGRVGAHPLQLAEVGAHHPGDIGGARFGVEEGQKALDEDRERDEEDTRPQGDDASVHPHRAASLRRGGAAGHRSRRLALLSRRRLSAVIIRLKTSSVMPMSIDSPAKVRTNQ